MGAPILRQLTDNMQAAADADKPTPVPIKVLLAFAALMCAGLSYNSLGGGWRSAAAVGSRAHEAAVPLQKRPRKSRYAHADDPDAPDQVVVGGAAAAAAAATAVATSTATAAAAAIALPAAASLPSVAAAVAPESFAAATDRMAALPEADDLSCHARDGFDIAGDAAYVWGLAFNVASAAECCAACAAQRRVCGKTGSRGQPFWRASRRERTQGRCSGAPGVCNAWVFCPGSDQPGATDRCFSYTIHNHSKGECWLKHEANESYPIAHGPTLPLRMRRAPRRDWPWAVAENVWPWEVPERVPWQAGIMARKGAAVWRGTRNPEWHTKFCKGKHGPC